MSNRVSGSGEGVLEETSASLFSEVAGRVRYEVDLPDRITPEEPAKVRDDRRRMACVDRYLLLAQEAGHHPTATELLRQKAGRSLQWQIRRGWGSLRNFREALGIAPPVARKKKCSAEKGLTGRRENG